MKKCCVAGAATMAVLLMEIGDTKVEGASIQVTGVGDVQVPFNESDANVNLGDVFTFNLRYTLDNGGQPLFEQEEGHPLIEGDLADGTQNGLVLEQFEFTVGDVTYDLLANDPDFVNDPSVLSTIFVNQGNGFDIADNWNLAFQDASLGNNTPNGILLDFDTFLSVDGVPVDGLEEGDLNPFDESVLGPATFTVLGTRNDQARPLFGGVIDSIDVTLIPDEPTVAVPSPAAAGLGLSMLALLAMKRRDRKAAY
ncbi:hypothetical protein [Poriferisphaera sp. WC338]|uniref:hypothetical protein n=1 Tax=Poriferisphaera sp. WC338 TaxID=3425129 RepID=UPI003D815AEF